MGKKKLIKGILSYKNQILETLDWLKEDKSEKELRAWCRDFAYKPIHAVSITPDTIILCCHGDVYSLSGRIRLIRLLDKLKYVKIYKDKNETFIKKLKEWEY